MTVKLPGGLGRPDRSKRHQQTQRMEDARRPTSIGPVPTGPVLTGPVSTGSVSRRTRAKAPYLESAYWAFADVLGVAAALDAAALPPPLELRQNIMRLLEQARSRAHAAGMPDADAVDACYAVVALVDERLVGADWQGRQQWQNEPLQMLLFRDNSAGDGFFYRLERLRTEPHRAHVLQVYFLCLALGFRGRYGFTGTGDVLLSLREDLARSLERALPPSDPISPHGLPPANARRLLRREAPIFVLSGALVAVALLAFVVLKVVLVATTSSATDAVESLFSVTVRP